MQTHCLAVLLLLVVGCDQRDDAPYRAASNAAKDENKTVEFCLKVAAIHNVARDKQKSYTLATFERLAKQEAAEASLSATLNELSTTGVDPDLSLSFRNYVLAHQAYERSIKNVDQLENGFMTSATLLYATGGASLKSMPGPTTIADAHKITKESLEVLKASATQYNDVVSRIETRDSLKLSRLDPVVRRLLASWISESSSNGSTSP